MFNINNIQWRWLKLDVMSAKEFYAVAQLRQDVFILEQSCLYADLDELEPVTHHLLGTLNDELVAYVRVLFPEKSRDPVYFSREVIPQAYRGKGFGKMLMEKTIAYITEQAPNHEVVISVQTHLEKFYNNFAFNRVGAPYSEDGIQHIAMRRLAK
jgi:ElaA protein